MLVNNENCGDVRMSVSIFFIRFVFKMLYLISIIVYFV